MQCSDDVIANGAKRSVAIRFPYSKNPVRVLRTGFFQCVQQLLTQIKKP